MSASVMVLPLTLATTGLLGPRSQAPDQHERGGLPPQCEKLRSREISLDWRDPGRWTRPMPASVTLLRPPIETPTSYYCVIADL
jgi:hypothetical protein